MKENKKEPLSEKQIREVMRNWATGVTVVTSNHSNQNHGMTVSSFSSISLEPPLVMIALERSTRTRQLVIDSKAFGITILSENQQEISNQFAGWVTDEGDRFEGLETFTLDSKSPMIKGGLGYMDCKVESVYEVGTHTLIIGEVTSIKINEGNGTSDPLLYFNQKYHQLKK
ncbi:MAG: flavin reductase [Chloroflexi bacterium]|jgi:flavin reductase (DIM6/NTAB) family NADH-FMN oxidoreductase RutF|nr:flavin reductase [Chloroflexota bacterium]MBT3670954.1 flavin reductase [Chloroflexota bacterium]MBT4002178.1 flavin reductase [Chloroflexota bacterium]MBT4306332.1 flavin reductase [Chloroflexota bacterium]MBT4532787.1 flavin reductase [Chloroflexota bacterium]